MVVCGKSGFGEAGSDQRRSRTLVRKDAACAEHCQPWIDKGGSRRKSPRDSRFGGETESFERAVAKDRGHCQVWPLVDGNLGAQPVNQQPTFEIREALGFGVEEYRL